jgi:serine/threonine protein kinase
MAAVFAARESGPLDLGRLVALKVMSAALVGDPESERMFLREASVSARLEHRNIVRVYEVGEADGTLYISMEMLHGATLHKLCADAPPPLPIALQLLADIAKALHFAHELRDKDGAPLSLVHQDVTPHNVMLTYGGVTKLLDFGVARIGAMDASRTETIRGKPAYLAPEQILGERIDRRSDVFALGAIAYELLTGKRLFEGASSLEIYAAITSKPIARAGDSDLPDSIAAIADRATERDPEARFGDVAAMAKAIDEARSELGIEAQDDAALADWARERTPPAFSLIGLEQEITRGEVGREAADRSDDPSERATEVTARQTTDEAPTKSETRTRAANKLQAAKQADETRMSSVRNVLIGLLALVLGVIALQLFESPATTTMPAGGDEPRPDDETASASTTEPPPAPTTAPASTTTPSPTPSPAPSLSLSPSPSPSPNAPASATAAPQMGTIAVRSSPWGAVFLDGVPVGNSPQLLTTTPGAHTIAVRTPSGQLKQRTVRVRPGKRAVVQLVF